MSKDPEAPAPNRVTCHGCGGSADPIRCASCGCVVLFDAPIPSNEAVETWLLALLKRIALVRAFGISPPTASDDDWRAFLRQQVLPHVGPFPGCQK